MKTLFLVLVSILASDFITRNEVANNLNGKWEYDKIFVGDIVFQASDLNECGYKDILEIKENQEEEFTLNEIKLKGYIIGYSNKNICVLDPISYKYSVTGNSCETYWVRSSEDKTRLFSVSEGLSTEYKVEELTEKSLVLIKNEEIVGFGIRSPDRIEMIKITEKD